MKTIKNIPIVLFFYILFFTSYHSGYGLETNEFPYSSFTSVYPVGDVDGNSIIDIVDALLIARYYVGLTEINPGASADTDMDGSVTIVDALKTAQFYVGIIQKTAMPEIDPAGGWYTSGRTMTISSPAADAHIYYTTDGSVPFTGSSRYSSPLLINQTTTVKTGAMKQGDMASDICIVHYSLSDTIVKRGVWECPYFTDTESRHTFYAIKDNYLYVYSHYIFTDMPPDYLIIFDLTDPVKIRKAGFIELDFSVTGSIFIKDDYLYVTSVDNFRIFDVSDVIPRYVSTIEQGGSMIKISGKYGYINYASNSITIVDLHNPALPRIINTFTISGTFNDYEIYGDNIYFVKGSDGILVMNIEDKQNPVIVTEYPLSGYISHVEVAENHLFLAASGQVIVIDITDPAQPVTIGQAAIPVKPNGSIHGFVLQNNMIAIGSGYEYCFVMFDVSDPASPQMMYHYLPTDIINHLYFSGNTIYVQEGHYFFRKIDITDVQHPYVKTCIDTKLTMNDVFVAGNYAYAYDYDEGIKIFDVSDPSSPLFISPLYNEGIVADILVRGTLLYYVGSGGLTIVDVADPLHPGKISHVETTENVNSMFMRGHYVYMTQYDDGLYIVDVTNPDRPELLSQTKTNHHANAVYVPDEQNAYISDTEARLLRMDISDPAYPEKMNFFGYQTKTGLFGYGYNLFSIYNCGLEITAINDPANPVSLSTIQFPSKLIDIFAAGDYALVTCLDEQAELIDISDPGNPVRLGMLDDSGNARGVFVSGNYIYATREITSEQSPEGLIIYEIR
ncbi:MAG: chitobiase/beta-hexosaminidase C-terminal domain-containing protein [Spirochaetales bacterium]|nr:chitobiase/beta-hexosaminidase C-terminal domain-containing protein [Spirochaetales bacterium]